MTRTTLRHADRLRPSRLVRIATRPAEDWRPAAGQGWRKAAQVFRYQAKRRGWVVRVRLVAERRQGR